MIDAGLRIVRMREVTQWVSLSRSTIYRLVELGEFPAPMKLGKRAIGWYAQDIDIWCASRPQVGAGDE